MAKPYSPASLTPAQWWCVLKEVNNQFNRTNLNLVSAGIAFYALMAIIPGLAATLALFGYFGDPSFIAEQTRALRGIAPDAVLDILNTQAARLLGVDRSALLAGGLVNIALSLWSALQGARWVLLSLTIVNRRTERRHWFRQYVVAGLFTLGGIGMITFTALVLGGLPLALSALRLHADIETWMLALRWPILGGAAVAGATMLYRWGPRRKNPPALRWLWPGAIGAPILWVVASSVFTLALRAFPSFGAAYGSLASVVAFLLWLYVSAMIFMLGGALNAELEYFTDDDKPPAGGAAAPQDAARKIDPLEI
ncbi:MAG TPA: YihY/virulence factor BrkB family protein [Caulobacterales bacterium]|nr:YihY/virulence factor BrkB family protein [Caulobacterales bacterium]